VEQLTEIKIVSPELLEWMEVSSSSNLQKINLNKSSFQALNSHPYISYDQTKALLQYIRLYGNVKDEQALLETGIFTKEELEKLKPYVDYE
jgi:DNA uptake protein ComE-like DNA-binding protein